MFFRFLLQVTPEKLHTIMNGTLWEWKRR